jgi:MiaB/RimO family radical SAM methylthiotransferase
VFGTHNLRLVPAMVRAAAGGARRADVSTSPSVDRFDLPERHPDFAAANPGRAYLTVMEGCDLFCAFCIVPTTRGREVSRPADAIVAEAEALARRGVVEVVLLGQTVNAYGRHDARRGRSAAQGTTTFATLLRRIAAIPGLRRIRYTSPHPIFFDDDLVGAHGELEALCPHVHLPVQSGSDAVLAAMRRRYGAADVRRLADRLRAARPDLVLTTDLIVGFPGETDADFEATLALVRDAAFVDGFSFKYSPRPGTAAAALADRVPARRRPGAPRGAAGAAPAADPRLPPEPGREPGGGPRRGAQPARAPARRARPLAPCGEPRRRRVPGRRAGSDRPDARRRGDPPLAARRAARPRPRPGCGTPLRRRRHRPMRQRGAGTSFRG